MVKHRTWSILLLGLGGLLGPVAQAAQPVIRMQVLSANPERGSITDEDPHSLAGVYCEGSIFEEQNPSGLDETMEIMACSDWDEVNPAGQAMGYALQTRDEASGTTSTSAGLAFRTEGLSPAPQGICIWKKGRLDLRPDRGVARFFGGNGNIFLNKALCFAPSKDQE